MAPTVTQNVAVENTPRNDRASVDVPQAAPPHCSRFWLPSEVARRLCDRHEGTIAGLRALAKRDRQVVGEADDRDVLDPFLWIYWDCVLIAIERRTRLPFRDGRLPRRASGRVAA